MPELWRDRDDEERERCKRAVDAMQELRFAFCLVRFTDLRESKEFMRHERLLDLGQLKYLHTMHDAVAFSAAHPVLFCSHQWLHGRHPDPDGVQHAAGALVQRWAAWLSVALHKASAAVLWSALGTERRAVGDLAEELAG